MKRGNRGIALVVVSGLLVGLSLLAVLFAQAARWGAPAGAARIHAAQAALAAGSGVSYAEGRLLADGGYDRNLGTAESRADDWTFRDGFRAPLAGADNPSYGRGEPWSDDGDGVREALEAPLADLDGNGRFSAWSGRIRSGGRNFGNRFSLKIVSAGGKFPVNAGVLKKPFSKNWVDIWSNKGVRHVLNTLGAVVFAHQEVPGRDDAQAAGPDPIPLSHLGTHLIEGRPAGGYQSLAQVRQALLAKGYSPAACDKILPCLNVGPYESLDGCVQGEFYLTEPLRDVSAVPVELLTAPREVLQALWLHQGIGWSDQVAAFEEYPDPNNAGQLTGLKHVVFPRSGSALRYATKSFLQKGTDKLMLYPDEAAKLADWMVGTFRVAGNPGRASWMGLRRALVKGAFGPEDFFSVERAPLAAADPGMAEAWVRAKADLAFYVVSSEKPSALDVASNWCSWGIPYGYQVAGVPVIPFWGLASQTSMQGMPPLQYVAQPMSNQYPPPKTVPYCTTTAGDHWPVPGTLGASTVFEIESSGTGSGAVTTASGVFRAAARIEFSSQEDFENLTGGGHLAPRRGITVVDPAPAGRRKPYNEFATDLETGVLRDEPDFPGIVSIPHRNIRWLPLGDPWLDTYDGPSGALSLAARATGSQGACQYAAFTEWQAADVDGDGVGDAGHEFFSRTFDPATGLFDTLARFERPRLLSDEDVLAPYYLKSVTVEPSSGDQALVGFDLPGITDVDAFQSLSLELWTAPVLVDATAGEEIRMRLEGWGGNAMSASVKAGTVRVSAKAAYDPAQGGEGIAYHVFWNWESVDSWNAQGQGGGSGGGGSGMGGGGASQAPEPWKVDFGVFVPLVDINTGSVLADMNHVVVTIDCPTATASLYVNGLLRGAEKMLNPPTTPMKGLLLPDRKLVLNFQGDDVRLYNKALQGDDDPVTPDDIQKRYDLGRFVMPRALDKPSFVSPLYVLDRRTRIGMAGWTGIPEGAPVDTNGVSLDRIGIRVSVHGYLDAAGNIQAPGFPVSLDDPLACGWETRPTGFGGTGEVRSFRYVVEFENAMNDEATPIQRTPYFEGIWLTLTGGGRSPRRFAAPEWR